MPNNVWQVIEGISSSFTVLAVFVAIGYIVHQVRATAILLDKVVEKLDEHMLDRKVHPDVPALNEELRALRAVRPSRGGAP